MKLKYEKSWKNLNLITNLKKLIYSLQGLRIGANEIRTHDLLHAMQALSHLSYGPEKTDFITDEMIMQIFFITTAFYKQFIGYESRDFYSTGNNISFRLKNEG